MVITTQYMRKKQALSPPDLLITTPETLQAILPGRVMKGHLKNVRYVVVDEIHEFACDKAGRAAERGLERLQELTCHRGPENRQIERIVGLPESVSQYLSFKYSVEILKVSTAKLIELTVERSNPKNEAPQNLRACRVP